MEEIKLHRTEFDLNTGQTVKMLYNKEDDVMEIFFGENENATGIELTDHILLRVNAKTARAVSLAIRHFSIHAEQTEFGPRSYPLSNLDELPEDLKKTAIRIISTPPVNFFLGISNFQAIKAPPVPFAFLEPAFTATQYVGSL